MFVGGNSDERNARKSEDDIRLLAGKIPAILYSGNHNYLHTIVA